MVYVRLAITVMDFPRFNGIIAAPPPPESPLAYNEDTIVGLILQILTLLTRIRHIQPGELVYPALAESPGGTSRHANLDRALCNDELHLSPRVTSLLGRIPYFVGGGSGPQIAPGAFLPDYLDTKVLRASRRLVGLPPWLNNIDDDNGGGEALRPHDVLLTYSIDPDDVGETWILDTEANTIRRRSVLASLDPDPETVRRAFPAYAPERPDEPGSYRNAPALHAPTVLAGYIDELRGLVLMPNWEMNGGAMCFAFDYPETAEVRRRLMEEYGWPGEAFREGDWARDWEAVWDEVEQWSSETYGDGQEGYEPLAVMYVPPWV